jgi:Flp pilus assembly protein TadG
MKPRLPFRLGQVEGQSVVELAIILPVLVLLMLGLVDLSRAIQAYNIIANMSREGANLALRASNSANAQDIMNSLANTAQPLAMTSRGMMYVTEVRGVAGSDSVVVPVIRSKTGWKNKTAPSSTVHQGSVPRILKDINLKNGDKVFIFEVFYRYDSLFNPNGSSGLFSPQLHSIAIF